MTFFVPCNHSDIEFCSCLTKKEKNNKNVLLRYHYRDTCLKPEHLIFSENGYHQVQKPTWKYACFCPYKITNNFVTKLNKICQFSNLKCECTTRYCCNLCDLMDYIFWSAERKQEFKEEKKWFLVFTELANHFEFHRKKLEKQEKKN
jgi:hypothetical protein